MNQLKKWIYKIGAGVLSTELYTKLDFSHNTLHLKVFEKQREFIGRDNVSVIFDVGARFGAVSRIYRQIFPTANIYAFEPFPESFKRLSETTSADNHIHCFNTAISDKSGEELLHVNKFTAANSTFRTAQSESVLNEICKTQDTLSVKAITINDFMNEKKIDQIDILKLDIQGGELKALKGAENLLKNGKIIMIYAEVSFINIYESQPLFHDVAKFLYSFGYRIIDIYNPWYIKNKLIWADALFISTTMPGK